MTCLSLEQIERLAKGEVHGAQRDKLRAHIDQCATCRQQLATCLDNEELLVAVRDLPSSMLGVDSGVIGPVGAGRAERDGGGQTSESAKTKMPLPSFPGYQLLRALDRGGQGMVYEAIQESTKRKVALKVLLPGVHATDAERRRFEREIEIVAQLRHPYLVAIYDAGLTDDGRFYYAMEYVDGQTLQAYVRSNHLTIDDTLKLFLEVCQALQYAHQRGIIHRDLKPSNILVDAEGHPKVLDFGLAKQLSGDARKLTLTEQLVGTLPYMAPEQTRGNPNEVDTRTDVYALGVVLFELLTGKFPYPVAGELMEVLKHIAQTPPERPSQVWNAEQGISSSTGRRFSRRSPIHSDLETIVMRALAKESDRRYQSAGDLADDVDHFLHGDPIEAKRDSALYILRNYARRHFTAALVTACVLLILLSGGWISALFYRQALVSEREHTQTIDQLHSTEAELAQVVDGSLLDQIRLQVLPWFLLDWQAGRLEYARATLNLVDPNSPQAKAMQFLLNADISPEQLLAEMPAQHHCLALFVIGERYLYDQDEDKAQYYFLLCLGSKCPNLIQAAAQARYDALQSRGGGEKLKLSLRFHENAVRAEL